MRTARRHPSTLLVAWLTLAVVGCDPDDDDDSASIDDDDDDSAPPYHSDPDPFCPGDADLAAHVDPMIGTDGAGNSIPGALVPHGLVRLSPDTVNDGGAVDAYEYDNDHIEGFTHTHWQGPGGGLNGYSQILVQPFVGPLRASIGDYASAFRHETEVAEPGYYAVELDDAGALAELTATRLTGVHRYTFPAGGDVGLLVDLGHSLGDSRDGRLTFVDDRTVEGFGAYQVHPLMDLALNHDGGSTGERTVYLHAVFDRPFDGHGTWTRDDDELDYADGADEGDGPWLGGYARFTLAAGEAVELRVGISNISVEQARANLAHELDGKDFDTVRADARAAWNCRLNRIRVEGGSDEDRVRFYTALYHTLMQPADHTEAGGVFASAADETRAVFDGGGMHFYTDDWCAWDTFRTSRPLATLIEPATVDDVVGSYLHLYAQGGWLPKCTWAADGYSRVMIGNHGVSIVADAFVKGHAGYDTALAWEALWKSATEDNAQEFANGLCGYANLGTPPEYLELGYVPHECDTSQSVSMTLEYAYDDWCTARVAEGMGKSVEAAELDARAMNYVNHWDPAVEFMRGRNRDGSWTEPFDPGDDSDINDFCEADSWIYSWYVPHDVDGLIALMGGPERFVERLDAFFADDHFEVSNEPSFHVPFLYNLAGRPDRTQEVVRAVLATEFDATPAGLPGNDDAGATSAWFVLAALGLYPLAPGDGLYQLSTPLFERTTIHLDPAYHETEAFVIEAPGVSDLTPYIQSVELDGEPLLGTAVRHEDIVDGGTLWLALGDTPAR